MGELRIGCSGWNYRACPGVAEARVSSRAVSPFWIWMQIAIVAFVLAGAIIAIVKLA